jgi:hypothetical protein
MRESASARFAVCRDRKMVYLGYTPVYGCTVGETLGERLFTPQMGGFRLSDREIFGLYRGIAWQNFFLF